MNSVLMIQNTLELYLPSKHKKEMFLTTYQTQCSSEDTEAGDLPGPVTTELP